MIINSDTRISKILAAHPDALEAIVSVNKKFDKLRNPLLRKLMAGRTSLAMAAKIGNCPIEDFYKVLRPLGFHVDSRSTFVEKHRPVPQEIRDLPAGRIIRYDVRPVIANGKDPLKNILAKLNSIPEESVFCLLNSFEPTPLIELLEGWGYNVYTEYLETDLIATWVLPTAGKRLVADLPENKKVSGNENTYDEILQKYFGRFAELNVVSLPPPQPMITILKALDTLADDQAVFVYHQRVPLYLLPELETRGYSLVYKEFSEGDVRLIIFKE